jgi:dihydrofolate reductase
MRNLRYSVAASLDGFIAGPNGEFDWIVIDPEIDFAAMYAGVGGIVMGRKSYDVFKATGGAGEATLPTYVCSRTLAPGAAPGVTILSDAVAGVRDLKSAGEGLPLWLWGGADLFARLAQADLVDEVEVAVIPVVLGDGIPLMAAPGRRLPLTLRDHRIYAKTGTVMLRYDVARPSKRRRTRRTGAR